MVQMLLSWFSLELIIHYCELTIKLITCTKLVSNKLLVLAYHYHHQQQYYLAPLCLDMGKVN